MAGFSVPSLHNTGSTLYAAAGARTEYPVTDFSFDHIGWGVDMVKRVNSPRVKILFDIYHAQIMDGDIVRNIRSYFPWIGHFHTGGNPGRHEIDDTQELNYRFIAQSIAALGYTGYIA